MSLLAAKLDKWFTPLRNDIFKFAHACGVDLTDQQRDFLAAVQRGDLRIAAKSGKGVGKTAATNVAGAWRTIQHKDALTCVTAPTMHQLRDVWLTEFGRMLDKARDPLIRKFITVTKTRVIFGGREKWNIRLVTGNKPEALQGIHQDHLTFILDEMSGIKNEFVDKVETTLTNEDSMQIATGNPNTRDCRFFDIFNRDLARWTTFTFDARKSPLVKHQQIQYIIDTYGEDSDVFRVSVLGEFPNSDPNCIISSEMLEKCTKNDLYVALKQVRLMNGMYLPAKQFGIDFARFGGDENVIAMRSGLALLELKHWPHTEPKRIIAHAFRMQTDNGWSNAETQYCADANGIGDGMMIDFHDADKNIHEFKTNHNANSDEYDDKMTEAWFTFAKKVRTGKVYLPNDRVLLQQLSTRQYDFNPSNGKIRVESKKKYMDRGHESPDRADACVMAFYDEAIAETQSATVTSPQHFRALMR